MRKLIERDGVLAVVGPITSRNLNAIKPTIISLKTPLLYATNYEGGACSRYIFSFSTVPNQELAQLMPYMNSNFGNTYYLLGANRLWPQKMFEAAQPLIAGLGGRVVGKEFTTGSETDFTAMIKRIADSKAKVLDEKALISVSDLGPSGETWSLNSLSFSSGRLYNRSLKEVVCIGR